MKPATKYAVLASASSVAILASLALSYARGRPTLPDQGVTDQVLTVPPGFEVERVAGPPLVDRPIVADFDDEGRLYVADSSGSNDKVEKQLADKPHRIVRLEDKNGDGRFDSSVVFADKMMFPEGAMWFDGSLYVAAPPSIWKLTDTDGDGVADQREEWFQGKTLTTCANDLHGPYLGPDGWIYWTKGAFAQQTYERPGKTPLCDPGLAHLPPPSRRHRGRTGDDRRHGQPGRCRLHACRRTDADRDLPGASATGTGATRLIHAIYGGLYGKPHAVIEEHKRTGDLMPELTHLGRGRSLRPHAICLARVRRRVSRQLLRDDVQPAEGDAPRRWSRAARRSRAAIPIFSCRTAAIFTRPTCSRMPTAACS